MKIFLAFVRKEFYHIFRDPRTMLILLLLPIVLIVLFGFAITNEIKSVPIGVVDFSMSEESRRAVQQLDASEYFELYHSYRNKNQADEAMRRGDISMVVVFSNTSQLETQLLLDASDPNQATQLAGYAQMILQQMGVASPTIIPITHLLYNPQMKSSYNFVPGIMGVILILICAIMTSIGIVREKETGTMEVLLVSPIKPIYIIIAKAVPYLVISIVNVITIMVLARFLLDVPILGGVALVMSLSILYSFVSLCLGLLVSTIVNTQQAALLFCAVILMLPVILLSGMIFPIENMPLLLQVLSNIVPARWYIEALRGVMIKGLGLADIWLHVVILVSMLLVLITISVKRFKIRLQ
ncbi:MAG: ABC transporter permease [bacterium]